MPTSPRSSLTGASSAPTNGIITQGIGVYATPLLQPTQITIRPAQGNPVYICHPTAIVRLPAPSNADVLLITDALGAKQRTSTVGSTSLCVNWSGGGFHVEHHSWAAIFGASSHGKLRTLADTVNTTPQPKTI